MKFPVTDFGPLRRQLADWGAAGPEERTDADAYYNAPARDFARTDEAPHGGGQGRARSEVEVGLAPGGVAAGPAGRRRTHVGYRCVAVGRERRAVYHLGRGGGTLAAGLDEVEGLGRFAELEIQAPE